MYRTCSLKLILCFLLTPLISTYSQSPETDKLQSLNNYVEFLNESVHGLAVAQILFVNYNKDLNKHVDLESHKINTHITNMELGANIFDNPDINTTDSELSAIKLSSLSKRESKHLNSHIATLLNRDVDQIVTILNKVNKLRFDIESFIAENDLDVKENIYQCYVYLEKTVALFESYHQVHEALSAKLRREILYEYKPMDFMFFEMHSATVEILRVLRNGSDAGLGKYLKRVEGTLDNFTQKDFSFNREEQQLAGDIERQIREMISFVKKAPSSSVPSNYKNNSKSYYIHNRMLLTYFNSISPGFVSKMNKLMSGRDPGFLHYDDRPVQFQVTYPEKMQELEEIATKNVVNTDAYPLDLKLKLDDPKPTQSTPTPPPSEPVVSGPVQEYLELEFFDPNLLDRDSITVSFNGEVILENHMLQMEPEKIRLNVDTHKGNAVTIVAKNEGIIAPNTIGFKYRFNGKGKKKEVYKNMNKNMAYELVLTIEGFGGLSDEKN